MESRARAGCQHDPPDEPADKSKGCEQQCRGRQHQSVRYRGKNDSQVFTNKFHRANQASLIDPNQCSNLFHLLTTRCSLHVKRLNKDHRTGLASMGCRLVATDPNNGLTRCQLFPGVSISFLIESRRTSELGGCKESIFYIGLCEAETKAGGGVHLITLRK